LRFTEEISPDQSTAQLVGPNGSAISGVKSAVDRADRTIMNVITPALGEGKYTIKWAAVTDNDNGHTNGQIVFTVAASSGASRSDSSSGGTSVDSTIASPGAGVGLGWILALSALVVTLVSLAVGMALRRR